ncbi:DUF2752 domain-containing protein [Candidatus Woesearchaeota archaeon]|nr:DUF2752 domain-containing protein [Candidatus Woesearchaeota archaeon]
MKPESFFGFVYDMLGFRTPQARLFNFSSAFVILASVPTELLAKSPAKCVWKHFLLPLAFGGVCPESGFFADCNCPACYMTRGISSILHGRFRYAWDHYNRFAFLTVVIMAVLLITSLVQTIKYYRKTKKIF